MGFFSWMTQDTGESISNHYSSRETFPVVMIDNKGNKWKEDNYEGYGEFGGKDYYVLLAEMNGFNEEDQEKQRMHGIHVEFGIRAIEHKETGKMFLGDGVDFFNWESEILLDGMNANQLVSSGKWKTTRVDYVKNPVFPNLVQDEDWTWVNKQPESCPDQGYFYNDEDEDEDEWCNECQDWNYNCECGYL